MGNELKTHENNQLALVKTEEEFVQTFTPSNMLTTFSNVTSIQVAVKSDSNGLSYYKNKFGQDKVLAMIETHLLALCLSLNVHEKLNEMQVKEIALEIISNYWQISLVEIFYVLKRAKKGQYGKIDYAINMPQVLDWFEQYTEERAQMFMNGQMDNHSNFKGELSDRSEERKTAKRHEQIRNKRK